MTSIVDTPPAAATPSGGDDLLEAIERRIVAAHGRFIDTIGGQEIYSPFALAGLVHEIVTEHTAAIAAELGTADGEVRYVVDLLAPALDERNRLRDENERLRAALAGRSDSVWD